jgi:hypothetical protein
VVTAVCEEDPEVQIDVCRRFVRPQRCRQLVRSRQAVGSPALEEVDGPQLVQGAHLPQDETVTLGRLMGLLEPALGVGGAAQPSGAAPH